MKLIIQHKRDQTARKYLSGPKEKVVTYKTQLMLDMMDGEADSKEALDVGKNEKSSKD